MSLHLAVDGSVVLAVLRLLVLLLMLVLVLLLLNVGWARSRRRRDHTEGLKCLLCGILSSVVDVLAIVPEASWELSALHSHYAAPSCATA